MSENEARLELLNEKISQLYSQRSSILSLAEAFTNSKMSFVDFFSNLYRAKLSESSWDHQTKLMYTYYEDLCEAMSKDMASDFSKDLENESMSNKRFEEYCRNVIDELNAQFEPLEKERATLVFSLARETLTQAA